MSKLDLTHAVGIFIQDIVRRNFSKYTIKNYSYYLKKFHKYLTANNITELNAVTLTTILNYHKHLTSYRTAVGKPYSSKSLACSIKPVVQLFRFLKHHELILLDPTEGIPPIIQEDSIPRCIMSQAEVNILLSQPDTNTLFGFRDRTIMEILYSTGIRRSEVIGLQTYDLHITNGLIKIKGKGNKERFVPIGKIAGQYTKEYLDRVRQKILKKRKSSSLFLGMGGHPLDPDNLNKIIKTHVRKSSIKKPISCHTFRHTCATEMLRGGASLRYVQELLGHKNLQTTQIYTRVIPVDLKKVHKKTHPRETQKDKKVIPFKITKQGVVYTHRSKNKKK